MVFLKVQNILLETIRINCQNLHQTYVILESVNERVYSIEPILSLIETWIDKKTSGIIHFSWPYPSGLSKFLRGINKFENANPGRIQQFHMGIRYCFELKEATAKYLLKLDSGSDNDINSFRHAHRGFSSISLEGRFLGKLLSTIH